MKRKLQGILRHKITEIYPNQIAGWAYIENSKECVYVRFNEYRTKCDQPIDEELLNNPIPRECGFTIDVNQNYPIELYFEWGDKKEVVVVERVLTKVASLEKANMLIDLVKQSDRPAHLLKILSAVDLENFEHNKQIATIGNENRQSWQVPSGNFSKLRTPLSQTVDTLHKNKLFKESLSVLTTYEKIIGKDEFWFCKLSFAYLKTENYKESLDIVRAGLNLYPESPDLYWHYMLALDEGFNSATAYKYGMVSLSFETSANRCLTVGQIACRALHGYGGVSDKDIDAGELSIGILQNSVAKGRNDGEPEYWMSQIYYYQGKYNLAITAIVNAYEKKKNPKYAFRYVRILHALGRHLEALQILEKIDAKTDEAFFLEKQIKLYKQTKSNKNYRVFPSNEEAKYLNIDNQKYLSTFNLTNIGKIEISSTMSNSGMRITAVNEKSTNLNYRYLTSLRVAESSNIFDFRMQSLGAHRRVALISRFGRHVFGGAERFLKESQKLYSELGFEVVWIAFERSVRNYDVNKEVIFVEREENALQDILFKKNIDVVHSVSGYGYFVANAVRGLKIAHVHGVHFWRDFILSKDMSGAHDYSDFVNSISLQEFHSLASGNGVVYCNSHFVAEQILDRFGVRLPVINSLSYQNSGSEKKLPFEIDDLKENKDTCVLLNSRADKGGLFVLEIAKLCPEIKFIIVSSQNSAELINLKIENENLTNVQLINHQSDVTILYRGAKLILVPSFEFVETFSRVVIEAQGFGTPVIGADVGNIQNLLKDSGVLLPKDATLWAQKIQDIFKHPEIYQELQEKALANVAQYNSSKFKKTFGRVINSLNKRILVGVGTGIGNVIHTTPLIAELSAYFQVPVDVVLASDFEQSADVFLGNENILNVYQMGDHVRAKFFDMVILTNSFGGNRYSWNSNTVIDCREIRSFKPGNKDHEAYHNINVLKNILGIQAPRRLKYSCGNIQWQPIEKNTIVLHGGSKGGKWAAKQWPFYPQLAELLKCDGYRIVCVGTKSEYISGCHDMTGLRLIATARIISKSILLISNDSGIMNVGNAIGVPQLAIFGPTSIATRGPLSERSNVISVGQECAPCEVNDPARLENGGCDCLKNLSVEVVYEKVKEILRTSAAL